MLFWMSACIIQTLVICIAPIGYAKISIIRNAAITVDSKGINLCDNAVGDAKSKIQSQLPNSSAINNACLAEKAEAGPIIHVKFSAGTDLDDPLQMIPCDLQRFVVTLKRLSTLTDQQLDKIGASHFKRWFEITLKPGTPLEFVIEQFQSSDHIDVVEPAPRPVPPPS
jgi:hypothetical protein